MSDRLLSQLGFATLALGIAMMAVPWLGAGAALGALAAVAVPSVVVTRRRLSIREPSHGHASSRA